MTKWIMTPLLGSLLLSGTWTGAQSPGEPPATAAAPAATSDAQSGPVVLRRGGRVVVSDQAASPGLSSLPPGVGAAAGGGFVTGPGPGPGFPPGGEGQRIFIRRVSGAEPSFDPNGPPFIGLPVQVPDGIGPRAIATFRTTCAGKAEKAAFLGLITSRPSATLRSQLKLKAGLVIEMVEPKTSADAAGLQVHDVIEKCDDQWLINPAQFVGLIRIYKPGETVTLTVIRQGERRKIDAKLEERETYALDDDNFFYAQQGAIDPNHPLGPVAAFARPDAGFGGPVQQITAGALEAAPLVPGFMATFGDDKQQLLITIHNGHQILTAKDPAGKQIFQGPIDTPEQLKALPQEVRKKFEEMEKIKVRIRTPNLSAPETDPPAIKVAP